MIKTSMYVLGSASLLALGLSSAAFAQSSITTDVGTLDRETAEKVQPRPPYSPPAGRNFPTRPFFGDTHLHTSFSFDAGAFGARLAPRDAYHFAKGEEVMASSGQPAKLARPLDFLVVADHAENMGFFPQLFAGKPEMLADPTGRRWYNLIQSGRGAEAAIEIIGSVLARHVPQSILLTARYADLPFGLAGNDQGGGRGERSRALHRLYRLRVDLEYRRQQPAPQRDLPRQRHESEPGRAVHDPEALGQRRPARSVEVDGGL